jgi:hypothetical protein
LLRRFCWTNLWAETKVGRVKTNPIHLQRFAILLVMVFIAFIVGETTSQSANSEGVVLPKIEMSSVPITMAIDNLARTAGINYLIDQKFSRSFIRLDGAVNFEQPTITAIWTNLTAKQALEQVLKEHNLFMADDPTTNKMVQPPPVTIHWHDVTARQAITALCQNYDLVIVKDPTTGAIQIKPKN